MARRIRRVVWDTCVIIDAIQRTPERYDLIAPFLEEAEAGRLEVVVSEVSVAEVQHLRLLEATHDTEQIVNLIGAWFDSAYIVRCNVHAGISEAAAGIGRVHRLKRAADAIVVATAVFEGIDTVHTFDGYGASRRAGLMRLDGKVGTPPIRITAPDPTEGTLWEGAATEESVEDQ